MPKAPPNMKAFLEEFGLQGSMFLFLAVVDFCTSACLVFLLFLFVSGGVRRGYGLRGATLEPIKPDKKQYKTHANRPLTAWEIPGVHQLLLQKFVHLRVGGFATFVYGQKSLHDLQHMHVYICTHNTYISSVVFCSPAKS